MHLDQQAVRPYNDGSARERGYKAANSSGVARIDNDRKVRNGLQHRHSGNVERVASRCLKGAKAALAQNDSRIAGHD